jgi:hypothetical protein
MIQKRERRCAVLLSCRRTHPRPTMFPRQGQRTRVGGGNCVFARSSASPLCSQRAPPGPEKTRCGQRLEVTKTERGTSWTS